MDPTEMLRQALVIAQRITRHADDAQAYKQLAVDAAALAERVTRLNDWLSRGHQLPRQWPFPNEQDLRDLEQLSAWIDKHDMQMPGQAVIDRLIGTP